MADAPGEWVSLAVCKNQRMWYTDHCVHIDNERSFEDAEMESAALALCGRCPVLLRCRSWAMTEPDPATDMVAGGLTPRQRFLKRSRL